jgi:chromate transport protein ChrA
MSDGDGSEKTVPASTEAATDPTPSRAIETVDPAVLRREKVGEANPRDGDAEGDGDADAGRAPSTEETKPASKQAPPSSEVPSTKRSTGVGWTKAGSLKRRVMIAAIVYAVCLVVFAAVAGSARLSQHTAFNHYAHLADAWLHGRHDLAKGPPAYAQMNDFASFEGKWFITFPPFPAVLMLPLVALAGSPENFQDGQFIVWLAGVGPALLFLVLERLRSTGRSSRSEKENIALALLFAFGTVYFFTAVEGTVWFAAHVVAVGLTCGYLLVALDAERPAVAGLLVACAWMTRPPLLFASAFFVLEAVRVSCPGGAVPRGDTFFERVEGTLRRVDRRALARKLLPFAIPLAASLAIMAWMNLERFHDANPFFPVHQYLTVAWKGRMLKWGLFSYHYLSKNLGAMLTVLPWLPPKGTPAAAPFQINEHGLALWFTTPLYLWLFRPKDKGWLAFALAVGAAGPLLLDLLYQNSGWRQFGYRFSNDYAPLLFVMLAVGGRPMGSAFRLAAAWAVAWNLFGAVTFDRGEYARFYWAEGTQTILHQPD